MTLMANKEERIWPACNALRSNAGRHKGTQIKAQIYYEGLLLLYKPWGELSTTPMVPGPRIFSMAIFSSGVY